MSIRSRDNEQTVLSMLGSTSLPYKNPLITIGHHARRLEIRGWMWVDVRKIVDRGLHPHPLFVGESKQNGDRERERSNIRSGARVSCQGDCKWLSSGRKSTFLLGHPASFELCAFIVIESASHWRSRSDWVVDIDLPQAWYHTLTVSSDSFVKPDRHTPVHHNRTFSSVVNQRR